MTAPRRLTRGRPIGGGQTTEQARQTLMDAAERLFIGRGYRNSTMEDIASEAGYSRRAIYRQFPTRRHLLEAMVQRTTQRYISTIPQRVPEGAGLAHLMVEGLVIVATELAHDPLLRTMAEQTPDGTVAALIANDNSLTQLVHSTFEAMDADETDTPLRPGVHPHDLAQLVITTALGLLLGIVPGVSDPVVARAYLRTFVLPAIIDNPPQPSRVFA
jgi:AcrR family transcriptional regulator